MADVTSVVNTSLASAASRMDGKTTSSSSASLNFNDYITLMVAQLQNQDMYSDNDTSAMTEQMAQYSLVSAAQEMLQAQNAEYATSLIGKEATASYSSLTGTVTETGTITGVSLYNNEPLVYINGEPFNLSEISIIGSETETASAVSSATDTTASALEELLSALKETDTDEDEEDEDTVVDTLLEMVDEAIQETEDAEEASETSASAAAASQEAETDTESSDSETEDPVGVSAVDGVTENE